MAENIEEILADVKQEGENPFEDMEKETPSESPTEKEPEMDKPEEGDNTPEEKEENIPFHKHPRWIERERELNRLKEQEEENARVIAELSAFKEEAAKKLEPTDTKIPDWFSELYGENDVAWKKYSEYEEAKELEIERRVISRQEQARKQAEEQNQYWNRWVDDEISKLEATGRNFDRNELIKTMLDYAPTDGNGNLDFEKGYKIYDTLKSKEDKTSSQAKKVLADTTTRSSTGERKSKDFMTADELRRKSWQDL